MDANTQGRPLNTQWLRGRVNKFLPTQHKGVKVTTARSAHVPRLPFLNLRLRKSQRCDFTSTFNLSLGEFRLMFD